MNTTNSHEAVGSVAEEAARLLDGLLASGILQAPSASNAGSAREPTPCGGEHSLSDEEATANPRHVDAEQSSLGGGHGAMGGSSTCMICPVCRGLDFVQSRHPDLLQALAELAESAAGVLRTLATAQGSEGVVPPHARAAYAHDQHGTGEASGTPRGADTA